MTETADWSILQVDGLIDEVRKAARSIAVMFPTFSTAEDLEQEGLIWCATHADQVRALHARGDTLLPLRLWSKLRDKVRTEAARQGQTISIQRLYEVAE